MAYSISIRQWPNRTHRVNNSNFEVNRLLTIVQPRVSFAFTDLDRCVVLVAFGNYDLILFCQILRRRCGNVEFKMIQEVSFSLVAGDFVL